MTYDEFAAALATLTMLPEEQHASFLKLAESLSDDDRKKLYDEMAAADQKLQEESEETEKFISDIEGDVSELKKNLTTIQKHLSKENDDSALEKLEEQFDS